MLYYIIHYIFIILYNTIAKLWRALKKLDTCEGDRSWISEFVTSFVSQSIKPDSWGTGNCVTVDAIHATRLLFETHGEKQKPLHAAFLDLENAFDCVPLKAIWHALRTHEVHEELIEWVKLLYNEPKSRVQATPGTTKEFHITVGVHQGLALSPLLFILVMNVVTRDGRPTAASAMDTSLCRQRNTFCWSKSQPRAECPGMEQSAGNLNVKTT